MLRSASARLALLSARVVRAGCEGKVGRVVCRILDAGCARVPLGGLVEYGLEIGASNMLTQMRPQGGNMSHRPDQPATLTCVQVSGGLVQRQDAAVEAEGLRQCQPDDEAGQHLERKGASEW